MASQSLSASGRKMLDELEETRCSTEAVRAIRELLERAPDFDLYKVNAFRMAVWPSGGKAVRTSEWG